MFKISLWGLIAAWIVWSIPFLSNAKRMARSRQDIAVTVSAAKRGILLQTIAYFFAWFYFPRPRPLWLTIAALLLAALAIVIARTALRALGRQWRVEAGLYRDHELVRGGPYRIVRHPIYASMLAFYVATALIMSIWQVALPGLIVFLLGTEIRVRAEDNLLAGKFGEQFTEYKAKVRAYLPFVR